MPKLDGTFSNNLAEPQAPDAAQNVEPSAPAMPTINAVASTLQPAHSQDLVDQGDESITPLGALVLAG
jgi:hypothetical protein